MKKRWISLTCAFLAVLMVVAGTILQARQQAFAEKLIRLHVVANSDTSFDQSVKLQVRDAVLSVTQHLLKEADDPKQALCDGLSQIEAAATDTLRALGCSEQVCVRLGKEVFPTRKYDTFTLPAGVYESLRVSIGEANGHNWWCVVFPSICLTASMDELEQAAEAAGITEGELRLITEQSQTVVLRFKLLELLQQLKAVIFRE